MEDQIIQTSIELILPVMESAMIYAADYSKACKRTYVHSMDMKYGLRYAARHVTGKKVGSFFPEIYEEESESDDEERDDVEVVEEEEDDFTRYTGPEQLFNDINEAYDTWDDWVPENPIEKMLKESVDSQSN
jgi:hypothetical protein